MPRVYVSSLGIALLLLIAISIWGTIAEAGELKPGTPNTITLPNGDVVYDLNGEWDQTGYCPMHGTFKDIVKITQKDDQFFGVYLTKKWTKMVGGGFVQSNEAIKGIFKKDGFEKLETYHPRSGWILSPGKISENGNKIEITQNIENMIHTITLQRK